MVQNDVLKSNKSISFLNKNLFLTKNLSSTYFNKRGFKNKTDGCAH